MPGVSLCADAHGLLHSTGVVCGRCGEVQHGGRRVPGIPSNQHPVVLGFFNSV